VCELDKLLSSTELVVSAFSYITDRST